MLTQLNDNKRKLDPYLVSRKMQLHLPIASESSRPQVPAGACCPSSPQQAAEKEEDEQAEDDEDDEEEKPASRHPLTWTCRIQGNQRPGSSTLRARELRGTKGWGSSTRGAGI